MRQNVIFFQKPWRPFIAGVNYGTSKSFVERGSFIHKTLQHRTLRILESTYKPRLAGRVINGSIIGDAQ